MTLSRVVASVAMLTCFAAILMDASTADSHPLAPTGLHIVEAATNDEAIDVVARWRTPRQVPRGERLAPVWPDTCTVIAHDTVESTPLALTETWDLSCAPPRSALEFHVRGLASATTNVLYTVTTAGTSGRSGILEGDNDTFGLERSSDDAGQSRGTFSAFFVYGLEHLLGGIDHVLFLLGVLVLSKRLVTLVSAVSAFTVGHGISLALTVFSPIKLPGEPVELAIALSLVVLAIRILRENDEGLPPWPASRAALLCGAFGLLHGLGLAGAFLDTGIAREGILPAMAGFNIGVEAGQLLVVAVFGVVRPVVLRVVREQRLRVLVAYTVGIASVFWALERAMATLHWLAAFV